MTTITIRDVPEEIRDKLAGRAAREGRSMQSYLLDLLSATATTPTQSEVIDRVRRRVEQSGSRVTTETILAMLDDDRRR